MSEPTQPVQPDTIAIAPQHQPAVQRADHLLSFLRAEAARLEASLRYVRDAAANTEQEAVALIQREYGVLVAHDGWVLDASAAILRRAQPAPAQAPAPAQEAPSAEPA